MRSNADIAAVSLDAPAGSPNVTGSDENLLQFHQSDDAHSEESVIADRSVRTPEEIFAGEEMVAQLDLVLHGLSAREREVFVLCTLEGFTVDEISRITDLTREQVRKAIWHAREWVRRKLPAENELRRSLLRGSQVA